MRKDSVLRITERDAALVLDVALSNVMTVEDIVGLGYFAGVSRARRRAAQLAAAGYLRRSFSAGESQIAFSVFGPGPLAPGLAGLRLPDEKPEIARRSRRPFARTLVEHSLLTNGVRRILCAPGASPRARFTHELLARHAYYDGGAHVFRPDARIDAGAETGPFVAYLESDTGSVSAGGKWRKTVAGYCRYFRLGLFQDEHPGAEGAVLVVTAAGPRRISSLSSSTAALSAPRFYYATVEDLRRSGRSGRVWVREPGGIPLSFEEIAGGNF